MTPERLEQIRKAVEAEAIKWAIGDGTWAASVRDLLAEVDSLRAELERERTEGIRIRGDLMELYPADTNGDAGVVEGVKAELARLLAELEEARRELANARKGNEALAEVMHVKMQDVALQRKDGGK